MWFHKLLAPALFLAALTIAPTSSLTTTTPPPPEATQGPCKMILGVMVCW